MSTKSRETASADVEEAKAPSDHASADSRDDSKALSDDGISSYGLLDEKLLNPKQKRKWTNPIKQYLRNKEKARIEKEESLLKREVVMREDLERFLMEVEDRNTWVAYHLNYLNHERMKRREVVARIKRKEEEADRRTRLEEMKENGLSFFRGEIRGYKKWQNSGAKHLDFAGHQGPVTACKLSSDFRYILSSSEDQTVMLWLLETGECLKTLHGHTKIVNDCDIHGCFKRYTTDLCFLTCSGDCTLRLWNDSSDYSSSSSSAKVAVVRGHTQAVYKCAFSPNGKGFVSCGADKTIRTWCYPEGYLLFIFRGHCSDVSTVRFSPTGRFLVSGSDYGERKVLLWNAKLPVLDDPKQFPHIIFWTPDGLIRKILIHQGKPKPAFWLQRNMMSAITDESMLDMWFGEIDDPEIEDIPSESEDDDDDDDDDEEEEEKKEVQVDPFIADDVRAAEGVSLRVVFVNGEGEQVAASEYNPGGVLFVCVQSIRDPISAAYVDVVLKSTRFDMFSPQSGQRVGRFNPEGVIPWRPEEEIPSSHFHKSHTPKRAVPRGIVVQPKTADQSQTSMEYRESLRYEFEDVQSLKSTTFEVMWCCPQPELGDAVVSLNCQLRSTGRWVQLSYSLKESAIRVSDKPESVAAPDNAISDGKKTITFNFDQLERHRVFWEYLRAKDWTAVSSFLEKKVIAYRNEEVLRRKFRVMNLLADMFDSCHWVIIHSPYIYSPGITKSVALCDTEYFERSDDDDDDDDAEDGDLSDGDEDDDVEDAVDDDAKDGDVYDDADNDGVEGKEVEEDMAVLSIDDQLLIDEKGDDSAGLDHEVDVDAVDRSAVPSSALEDSSVAAASTEAIVPIGAIAAEEVSALSAVDEGASVLSMSSMSSTRREGLFNRATTRDLKLPQILFVDDVEGKQFDAALKSCLREETHHVLSLLEQRVSVEAELHLYPADPASITAYKLLHESPAWISSAEFAGMLQLKADMIDKWRSKKMEVEQKAAPVEFTSVRLQQYSLIKSGKFGPDIEDLTMPLPAGFPSTALLAKHALKPVLVEHEQVLSKLKVAALPTSLEDVKEVTFMDRLRGYYHRVMRTDEKRFRRAVSASLESDVRAHLLTERTYHCARRTSHCILPGMAVHYPNPNYTAPALVLPGVKFPREVNSGRTGLMGSLFGTPSAASGRHRFLLPVGRKATIEQLRLFQADQLGLAVVEDEAGDISSSSAAAAVVEDGESKPLICGDFGGDEYMRSPDFEADGGDHVSVRIGRVPPGVFMGRRSYYPSLPGLEQFMGGLIAQKVAEYEAEQERKQREIDRDTASAYAKSMKDPMAVAKAVDAKDDDAEGKEKDRKAGILMRFRINGMELAHHGSVNDALFSPSEGRIATAGGDGLVKLWDPVDGTLVRSLKGHSSEVFCLRFSGTEQFLLSAGADAEIIIWSLLTQTISRRLYGHVDVIYGVAAAPDFSFLVSCSHDGLLKSWYTTPRHPDPPAPPRVLAVTDTTALLSWVSPPCFNLDVNAFHVQWRVGHRDQWVPIDDGLSVPPHYRTKMVTGLLGATAYQFRIRAENRMGKSAWSMPSRLTRTEFGIPEALPMPRVCHIGRTSVLIGWVSGNPETFGATSKYFDIQANGNGQGFDENPTVRVTLEQGIETGRVMMRSFQRLYDKFTRTKDAPIKSRRFSIHRSKRPDPEDEEQLPEIGPGIGIDTVNELLEMNEDRTVHFVVAEYDGLVPGLNYLFRIRGINEAGCGPWSDHTYSTFTVATAPAVPKPPYIAEATLRSILFAWEPPNNGGSAITGYDIILKNLDNKLISLPRSSVTYLWEGLFPGRSYFIQVQARNEVGESGFSDCNADTDAQTVIGPPDTPGNPRAVGGTWNSITLECRLSYDNGSRITGLQLERRVVDPFNIGDWEHTNEIGTMIGQVTYRGEGICKVPGQVTMVEFVDPDLQQLELEQAVRALELSISSSGFNPYAKDKNKTLQEIEQLVANQRNQSSSLIRFEVGGLEQDKLYEFRVRFINRSGKGQWSFPSHRAKTNKALLPAKSETPAIALIGSDFVTFRVILPAPGGSPIVRCFVETMSLEDDSNFVTTYPLNQSVVETEMQCRVSNLEPGNTYIFRCGVESLVGKGPKSEWTEHIRLPSLIVATQ